MIGRIHSLKRMYAPTNFSEPIIVGEKIKKNSGAE